MLFHALELAGAYVIEMEKIEDDRGFFARTWCQREFLEHGLDPQLVQCNISFNRHQGTLRGMHYQLPPHAETKLVRCVRGAIYDVIIDLRPDSATFLKSCGTELSEENGRMYYVPKGFAHGFVTLSERTEIFYQMSTFFAPAYARGVRWNDPLFGIEWPGAVTKISAKDLHLANATPEQFQPFAGMQL
jgi:dTDP-4-dehydrorhamnose 3,5-epimerase